MGLAERILAAIDLPPVDAGPIPEWGIKAGELFLRGMTGQERRDWELSFVRDEAGDLPREDPRSPTVGKALVDGHGNRVFRDDQVAALAAKSGALLDLLYDRVLQMSGIRRSLAEQETDRKNSETTPGSDSSSG